MPLGILSGGTPPGPPPRARMDFNARVTTAFGDRYAVEREIGRGGSSVVFLATDLRHPRKVAIKVLRPEVASAIGPRRFRREIEIESSLIHPHILPLHDSGESDGLLYFVMPAIEGRSLAEVLRAEGPLPVPMACRVGAEVASALGYAHRHGVIHRDIKPGNILLADDHAFVADFGIARLLSPDGRATTSLAGFVGTPSYMSPEQLGSGPEVDARSDIYALGCVLYEMTTGEPLVRGRRPEAIVARHLRGKVFQPRERRNRGIPSALRDVIGRCVAMAPEERFADGEELARALNEASTEAHGTRSGTRWMAAATVVLVGVIGLGVGLRAFRGGAAVTDPRKSYLVQAYRVASMSTEEEETAVEAAAALTRFLTGWREVTAVPEVSQASVGFSVGVAGSIRSDLAESLRLARAYPVGTLVTVTAQVRGDSAAIEAVRFDVATRRQVGDPIRSTGAREDIQGLVAPIALQILELAGAPPSLLIRRESSVVAAIQELRAGQVLLELGDLAGAESHFRAALVQDSTVGRAHYYLALARYWEGARARVEDAAQDPAIAEEAVAAVRYSQRMTYRDSVHAEAFAALALGDFDGARRQYEGLVRSDSADSYALLLLGATEFTDPMAVRRPDGSLTPRSSPNAAADAFLQAVHFSPQFALGFGFLFDQYRGLAEDPDRCSYRGFRLPGAAELPDDQSDPNRLTFLCAVALDTLLWVSPAEASGLEVEAVTRGAERYRQRAFAQLDRWRRFMPQSPRAPEEMALWHVEERRRLPPDRWSAADSLGQLALDRWSDALAAKADTTPADLARLADLALAAGEIDRSVTLAREALALADSLGVDHAELGAGVADPFLAAGRLEEALTVMRGAPDRSFSDVTPDRGPDPPRTAAPRTPPAAPATTAARSPARARSLRPTAAGACRSRGASWRRSGRGEGPRPRK